MPVGEDPVEDLRPIVTQASMLATRAAESGIRTMQDRKQRAVAQADVAAEELSDRIAAQARVANAHFAQVRGDAQWVTTASPREIAGTWRAAHEWAQIDGERFGGHARDINAAITRAAHVDLAAVTAKNPDLEAVAALGEQAVMTARENQERNTEAVETRTAARWRDEERRGIAEAAASETPEAVADAQRDQLTASARAASAEDAIGRARSHVEELDYDSPERREVAEQLMARAGVPAQQAHARVMADHINGVDPQKPRRGTTKKVAAARARQPQRDQGLNR